MLKLHDILTATTELTFKMKSDGSVEVEYLADNTIRTKQIDIHTLVTCISKGIYFNENLSSGLLPKDCISFSKLVNPNELDRESFHICLIHEKGYHDLNFLNKVYGRFPLPNLVFGYFINHKNAVTSCYMSVVADTPYLRPDTQLYRYPFTNVNNRSKICTGTNSLPKYKDFHTLHTLNNYILNMPNNTDYFTPNNNKSGHDLMELVESLKDKTPDYYYSDVLVPSGKTISDFIKIKGGAYGL